MQWSRLLVATQNLDLFQILYEQFQFDEFPHELPDSFLNWLWNDERFTCSIEHFTIYVNYVQLENNPTTKNITFQVLFETVNTDQYNPQQVFPLGFPHAYGLFNSTSTSLIYFICTNFEKSYHLRNVENFIIFNFKTFYSSGQTLGIFVKCILSIIFFLLLTVSTFSGICQLLIIRDLKTNKCSLFSFVTIVLAQFSGMRTHVARMFLICFMVFYLCMLNKGLLNQILIR